MLINTSYSSGSDTRALLAYGPYTPVPGHEGVGTVVKLGANAPETLLGARVGIKWLWASCGTCSLCRAGRGNNCASQMNTGKHVHGTMAEYALAKAGFVTRIPDGVRSEDAAPLLCAGLSLMGAVGKLDGLRKEDSVVILGAGGGLGHLGVQIAREKGFKVMAIDSGREKGELCLSLGATSYIDISTTEEDSIVEQIKNQTDSEGAHAAIVVPGTESAFRLAPKLVRNCGTIVGVGLPRNDFTLPVGCTELSARGLTITGASVGTEAEMEELLKMTAEGKVVPKVEVCGFEDAGDVLWKLVRGEVVGRIVVKIP